MQQSKHDGNEVAAYQLDFQQAIVVIRNPYDFIVANMYGDHLSTVPEEAFFRNQSE